MKTYRFDVDRLPARRRDIIRRLVIAFLIVATAATLMSYFVYDDASPLLLAAPLAPMIAVFVFVGRNLLAQLSESYEKARVELRPGVLTVRPAGGPGLTLHEEDVQSIQEARNGSLVVRGRTIQETACISPDLIGFEELRAELETWREIAAYRQVWTPRTLWPLLMIVGFGMPLLLQLVLPEGAPVWARQLSAVLYVGVMAGMCFMAFKRTQKSWVRIILAFVLVILSTVMLPLLLDIVGVVDMGW